MLIGAKEIAVIVLGCLAAATHIGCASPAEIEARPLDIGETRTVEAGIKDVAVQSRVALVELGYQIDSQKSVGDMAICVAHHPAQFKLGAMYPAMTVRLVMQPRKSGGTSLRIWAETVSGQPPRGNADVDILWTKIDQRIEGSRS